MPLKESLAAGSAGYPPLFLAQDREAIPGTSLKHEEIATQVSIGRIAEPGCPSFCPRQHFQGPRGAPDQLGSTVGASRESGQSV